ncbi:MAG: hypothetical protein IT515_02040 [Burkholderiales bacterium]|nr:hypothetical protein [Burkholderiales bacterium]
MKFKIEKQDERLSVRIENLAAREQEIVSAIHACRRQSAWACPSGECTKIDVLDVKSAGGGVVLTLSPRLGMELSAAGIEECLRYTLGELAVSKPVSAKDLP